MNSEKKSAKPSKIDSQLIDLLVATVAIILTLTIGSALIPNIRSIFSQDTGPIYSALVGLHGSLLGFVLAALTIAAGYARSSTMAIVRESGQLANVFRIFIAAAVTEAANLAISLTGLSVTGIPWLSAALFFLTSLFLTLAALRIGRTLWIVFGVVNAVS